MSDDPPESPKVPKFFDVLFPPPPSPAEQLAADKARFVKLRAGLEHVKTARSELLQCAAIGFCMVLTGAAAAFSAWALVLAHREAEAAREARLNAERIKVDAMLAHREAIAARSQRTTVIAFTLPPATVPVVVGKRGVA